ncbi:hypothetical protein VTN02DRAFT_5951 [Thermoascus thermophilus]
MAVVDQPAGRLIVEQRTSRVENPGMFGTGWLAQASFLSVGPLGSIRGRYAEIPGRGLQPPYGRRYRQVPRQLWLSSPPLLRCRWRTCCPSIGMPQPLWLLVICLVLAMIKGPFPSPPSPFMSATCLAPALPNRRSSQSTVDGDSGACWLHLASASLSCLD